jgi:hypothetical protein
MTNTIPARAGSVIWCVRFTIAGPHSQYSFCRGKTGEQFLRGIDRMVLFRTISFNDLDPMTASRLEIPLTVIWAGISVFLLRTWKFSSEIFLRPAGMQPDYPETFLPPVLPI